MVGTEQACEAAKRKPTRDRPRPRFTVAKPAHGPDQVFRFRWSLFKARVSRPNRAAME
jgi:hypothetical protein